MLRARGLDLEHIPTDDSKALLPRLLALLPQTLFECVPQDSASALLAFVAKYDPTPVDLGTLLSTNTTSPHRPSIQHHLLQRDLRSALPAGTPDATIAALAWDALYKRLPADIQAAHGLFDPASAPAAARFALLDRAWLTKASSGVSAALSEEVAAVAARATQPLPTWDDRLTQLERSMSQLVTSLAVPQRPAPTNPQPNTLPRAHPPSSTRTLCYYHARFGDKAYNCRPPCDWRSNADRG